MSRIVPKIKKLSVENARKKIPDRQKNAKFDLFTEKNRRDTASRHCKSFIMEKEDKKADLGQSFVYMSRKIDRFHCHAIKK